MTTGDRKKRFPEAIRVYFIPASSWDIIIIGSDGMQN